MGLYYLGIDEPCKSDLIDSIRNAQLNHDDGRFKGTELENFDVNYKGLHGIEHLLTHLTCSAVLPVIQQQNISINELKYGSNFCDIDYLKNWQQSIDWKNAWFEGNNILFVGQLLIYIRDAENKPEASVALSEWFKWLDREIDPKTSLWGTNGYCSDAEAVYGGYHQLLLYWYEDHPIPNPEGLVDTVLGLRHYDGGFNPNGNGGACEDVDCVDILVNCYKRWDYRRAEIRRALWHCVDHILETQNPDGGFPYNSNQPQSHMGIPGTNAEPNVSCTFPTWFRIHTLALCHEIIPEHPQLSGIHFRFNTHLSMGWHKSPSEWNLEVTKKQQAEEKKVEIKFRCFKIKSLILHKIMKLSWFMVKAKNKIYRCIKRK
jgi:hypothetical protein